MEIRVNRVEFLNELVPMQGIVERATSTIPILSYLHLRVANSRLEISATNLDVSLTSSCEGEEAEDGAIAIPAKKLFEIIRASHGDVTLSVGQSERMTIRVGKSVFKINGLPTIDFPAIPRIDGPASFEIPFATFKNLVKKVFFAISNDDSRFQLTGALLREQDDALCLAATDGHRLAIVESKVEGLNESDDVIVPRKALQEIQRFNGEGLLIFRRDKNYVSFTVGRRQLVCRILEGTFPDFERVISKDNDKIILCERLHLASVLNRVSLLTGDRSRAVRLELQSDQLVMSAANPDLGEAMEEVPCEYDGVEISLGVNPDYLSHFLSAADTERVRLEFKDQDTQCVAYPVDGHDKRYVCVIMPVRL